MKHRRFLPLLAFILMSGVLGLDGTAAEVPMYSMYNVTNNAEGKYNNPYTDVEAVAEITRPDGTKCSLPYFWYGGDHWWLRIRPDMEGTWSFTVKSNDSGLDGFTGSFLCVPGKGRGSIKPMDGHPLHFQYQNGERMWFMGDTAWGLLTDSAEERHDHVVARKYLETRAAQGFNVVHSMMLSEAGWGNSGGLPFENLAAEKINLDYWREVESRISYANSQGIVVGLALAWGDKRKQEPFAWRMFPDLEARKRYARYVAARYGAYDVYFIVSGEWHAEVRTRPSTTEEMKQEFIEIGDALAAADAHERMIAIHPMTAQGSVREFNDAKWMRFGDYQQNYRDLHERILLSRVFNKPVVNSEYGYHLRDQNGDGTPDKDNSTSLESIRRASWDIVMAGGYLVTGFGTTYFGGNRDPGPFNLEAAQNDNWERQIGYIKKLFTSLDWWKLEPHDAWLTCVTPRGEDGKQTGRIAPPAATYWLLAEPGRNYVVYTRGITAQLDLNLGPEGSGSYSIRAFSPITGEMETGEAKAKLDQSFTWTPENGDERVLLLIRVE